MSFPGLSQFQLSNEISPIILTGGIANGLPNQAMMITDLTDPGGTNGFEYNDYFAHFKNLPNGTLADWQIAEYPFASLVMAANAMIQMPLKISMQMLCPVQNDPNRDYLAKQSVLTNLQNQIQTHVSLGGTFTVVTPAYTYSDVLLVNIRDTSPPSDKQVQLIWQLDFVQPLITTAGEQQALGNFMTKAANGLPTLPTWNTQ
jgi:hypothetical protein